MYRCGYTEMKWTKPYSKKITDLIPTGPVTGLPVCEWKM